MSDDSDQPLGSEEAAPQADFIPKRKLKKGAKLNSHGLNDKQVLFAHHYLRTGHITNSAINAGYSKVSAHAIGSRLIRKAEIAAFIEAERARIQQDVANVTATDAKWVRQRLLEESKYFGKDATQAARIRAIELIAKLNGDFEADNKQKAGIFDGIPAEALDFVRERLRQRGDDGADDRPHGGFTH